MTSLFEPGTSLFEPGTQIVLTGPTASGKASVACALARKTGASIASVDSMKIYRGMNVVTAKPKAELREEIEFHLIDIVTPDVDFSVGDYSRRLREVLDDAKERARPVILCGGTALYLKAFLGGLAEVPGADWEVRERLQRDVAEHGLATLYARLGDVDPVAAAKILPEDERRIVRALEVFETTGRAISETWDWAERPIPEGVRLFGIGWERADLYARTDARVLRMVENGLFEEAERLAQLDPPLGRSAAQCIGYKEIPAGLAAGESRDEIIETIQRNTRHFVKRQMTWFRKMPIEWIDQQEGLDPNAVADEILERVT